MFSFVEEIIKDVQNLKHNLRIQNKKYSIFRKYMERFIDKWAWRIKYREMRKVEYLLLSF